MSEHSSINVKVKSQFLVRLIFMRKQVTAQEGNEHTFLSSPLHFVGTPGKKETAAGAATCFL